MRHLHHIRQIRIDDPLALEMVLVKKFAQDCEIEILPRFPLYFVFVDGELAAFYYTSQQVCIYPTVHPDRLSSRAFYEAACEIVASTGEKYANPLWLIEKGSHLNHPELLKKVGLLTKALAVYEVAM